MITPEEFYEKMSDICANGDPEQAHLRADDLMCILLTILGYGEGIKVYEAKEKWYA